MSKIKLILNKIYELIVMIIFALGLSIWFVIMALYFKDLGTENEKTIVQQWKRVSYEITNKITKNE